MRTTSFVALAVSTMAVLHGQTSAPNIPVLEPQYATFGMIGFADDQTARVNVLGLPMGGPIIAGASCAVTITFFDEAGKSLGSSTQQVVGGQAVHFDLRRTEIDTAVDRREIRATVRTSFLPTAVATLVPPVAFGLCSVKPTLEIFNSDGRTMAVLGGTTALPLILPLVTTAP
jgi:hypothetical protein